MRDKRFMLGTIQLQLYWGRDSLEVELGRRHGDWLKPYVSAAWLIWYIFSVDLLPTNAHIFTLIRSDHRKKLLAKPIFEELYYTLFYPPSSVTDSGLHQSALCSSFFSFFLLHQDNKYSNPKHWSNVSFLRRFCVLLQLGNVCITLPFSALLFQIIVPTCKVDSLVANREFQNFIFAFHYSNYSSL